MQMQTTTTQVTSKQTKPIIILSNKTISTLATKKAQTYQTNTNWGNGKPKTCTVKQLKSRIQKQQHNNTFHESIPAITVIHK